MLYHKNLYWSTQLDCELSQLRSSCIKVNDWVNDNIKGTPDPLDSKFHIFDVYNSYNFFGFPLEGISYLSRCIEEHFASICDVNDMWIKGWVNVYQNGQSYDWHTHKQHTWLDQEHTPLHTSWHGIYCVIGDDTCTTYKHQTGSTVHIPWKENQLVFVKNTNDWLHRTWSSKNRITVAFNILHREDIDPFRYGSNWLPL